VIGGQRYQVCYGGGHADGAWNGLVKFGPLNGAGSDAPRWSIFLAASASSAVRDSFTYSDGRQSAIHSYNLPCGVGDTVYVLATDAKYRDGGHNHNAFRFSPSGFAQLATNSGRGDYYSACAHYQGYIYTCPGGGQGGFATLTVYNIANNSYTSSGSSIAVQNYASAAVDTNRGRLFEVTGGQSLYWELTNPASPSNRRTGLPTPSSNTYGLCYDPDTDQFISAISGSLSVRTIDAASLAAGGTPSWQTRTFTGTTPSSGHSQGTYGRFQYIPELKGYLICPTSTSGVFFYRSA
jgi:hypothetical protein